MKTRYTLPAVTGMLCGLLLVNGCLPHAGRNGTTDSLAIRSAFSSSPVLSPAESMKKIQLEKGFTLQLVAAEPMIHAPVALTFDEKGRIWVVEMESYMNNVNGTGEDKPTGRIVILEDQNKDGVMDHSKVFLDSLVLPRAICLVEDGILVATPPNLWFIKIKNDRPAEKILVDSTYAAGGNPEHQSNGLYRAMDNWIYSAGDNSNKRYRKSGDHWLIERTRARGQWGLSQDDYGRLFYNNNSQNLLGDYFLPGLGNNNLHQRRVAGFNEEIVPDNRVFPIRPNTGVNRGYMKGILDDSLRLVNFTAACGPLIYRGGLFDKDYAGNAFVAEPAANLIKRDTLVQNGNKVSGEEAYSGKEFLASTDERFRPVSLYDGPDGALYVVDMYRGVIQHKAFLTEYLTKEIKSRELEEPLNCGRIYKILPAGKKSAAVLLPEDPEQLVKLLQDRNGWVRDKAQQMLVDGKYTAAVPALRGLLQQTDKPITVSHALWTLEGLQALQPADILPLLQQRERHIRAQAITVLSSVMTRQTYRKYLPAVQELVKEKDSVTAPYLAFLAHSFRQYDQREADNLLKDIIKQYPDDPYVCDAAINSLAGREKIFLTAFPDTVSLINKGLGKILVNIAKDRMKSDRARLAKQFPEGYKIFNTVCQSCHGEDGNGIKSLAPPLNGSEWVTGDKNKLISIVLFGLTGPIKVSGKIYDRPEVSGEMPAIGNDHTLTDEAIAQLLSYIRNSWNNKAEPVAEPEISRIRLKLKGRQEPFTMKELKK